MHFSLNYLVHQLKDSQCRQLYVRKEVIMPLTSRRKNEVFRTLYHGFSGGAVSEAVNHEIPKSPPPPYAIITVSSNFCCFSLITLLMWGSKFMVNGKKILKSATCKLDRWYFKKILNFFSSRSKSSNGSTSLEIGRWGRILKHEIQNWNSSITATESVHRIYFFFSNRRKCKIILHTYRRLLLRSSNHLASPHEHRGTKSNT